MWDDELNTAIDDVARGMTEGSPAALRDRVVARIESGGAPQRSWRASFVLAPLAAAAAIVVALFIARSHTEVAPASAPAATVRLPPSPQDGFGGTRKPDTTDAATAHPAPEPTDLGRLAPSPLRGFGGTRKPDTTDTARQLERLDVAPLAVGSLTPDPIQIEPLGAIAPMAIAPLDITDEPKER